MRQIFKDADVDVLLVANSGTEDSNFLYLTGFEGGVFEQTFLVVGRKRMVLFVSRLEYEIAKENRPREMEVRQIESRDDLLDGLSKELGGKTVGINGAFLPYAFYRFLSKLRRRPKSVKNVSAAFTSARLVKEGSEIARIRHAAGITKAAIREARAQLKEGMTERQAAGIVNCAMMKRGATTAFPSIVSFDSNIAMPHHMPDGTRLRRNSMVLFDVGARYREYCSDMTRTFMFMPDKRSQRYKRFKEIYSVVANAQRLALRQIKEGADPGAPHKAAANYINSYGNGKYNGRFIHALGHSIGLDVHDGGGLAPGQKFRLRKNMVFSDEPGIYIAGFGGVRIEDDVIVGGRSSRFI
jgi:Xaa-Pro dipeptidase